MPACSSTTPFEFGQVRDAHPPKAKRSKFPLVPAIAAREAEPERLIVDDAAGHAMADGSRPQPGDFVSHWTARKGPPAEPAATAPPAALAIMNLGARARAPAPDRAARRNETIGNLAR
jgi:hypothetical protein